VKYQAENPKRLLALLGSCCFILFLLYWFQSGELEEKLGSNERKKENLEEAKQLVYSMSFYNADKDNKNEIKFENLASLIGSSAAKIRMENDISSLVPTYDKKTQITTVKMHVKRLPMGKLFAFLKSIHETQPGIKEDRIDIKSAMLNGDRWNVYLQLSSHDSVFKK
jgi:hypothetical protein